MRKINSFFCISLFFIVSCSNLSTNIHLKHYDSEFNYKLGFESGYFFVDEKNLKVLLKFYRPNELFSQDTHEIIFLYICSEKEYMDNVIHDGKITAYFNRLQLKINYGMMDVNAFEITKVSDEELKISSKMIADTSSMPEQIPIVLKLNFSNIPVRKVNTIDELENYSTDYFKHKVRENIELNCIF